MNVIIIIIIIIIIINLINSAVNLKGNFKLFDFNPKPKITRQE